MKTLKSKIGFVALCSVTLLAFQNCADSQFSSVSDSAINKAQVSDDPADTPDETGGADENDGSMDPVVEQEADAECNQFKTAVAQKSTGDNISTNTRGAMTFPGANVVIVNHRGSASIPDALSVSVDNSRGSLLARTVNASALNNTRGSECVIDNPSEVVAGSAKGVIQAISNHRGRLEVSGLDIGTMDNTRGSIVLRDVHVQSITNHRGSIRLINSTVDSITNHRGSVSYQ